MNINKLWILISLALPTNALLYFNGMDVTNQTIQVAQGARLHVACRGDENTNWKMGASDIVTTSSANVYQIKGPHVSIVVIKSMKSSNAGTYTCHIGRMHETVTVEIQLSSISMVAVTKTVQGSSPALRVSWSAVGGSGITYTVCYSTTSGTQSDPPSNANCDTSGITGTSTTLGPLNRRTTYYIWMAAVLSGGQGPYSDRRQGITYNVPGPVSSLQVRPSTAIFGLIITWRPPSGSTYPTPVTYQLRYRERPSSGSPGGWSSNVRRTATQRQYTTPVLKPGTRYEVEALAVSAVGNGHSIFGTASTLQVPGPVTSFQMRPSTTIFGLIITWGPPSGSNYPTPVTYRLRYRERPSSGSPGDWSSTVQRTATQRQYNTPVLKPGTRYEVEVWAFVSSRSGPVRTMAGSTGSQLVQSLAARLHESQITWVVTWRPPLGIINPTGYRLRYRKTSSSTWSSTRTIGSQQTQYTITGLEEGATYEVEVWATFSNGEGSKTKVTTGSTALLNAPRPANDNTATIVGVLFGGIAIGAVAVLLVLGIVRGVYKLRKWKKPPASRETDPTVQNKVDAIYEKVDEAYYADVTMTSSPAYEGVTIR